jgi:integral membrane protein
MKSAVFRFRVMAIICGVLSLILWFFYMPAKYGFHLERTQPNIIWITQIHGALYIFYVLAALQLSVKMRKSIAGMLWMILAGTLPVASFILERKVVRQTS